MDTKRNLLPANKQENSKGHANYGWHVVTADVVWFVGSVFS